MIDTGLRDRVCIVTGGTRGLGRAVVVSLLEEGAKVIAVGSSQQNCEKLAEDLSGSSSPLIAFAQDIREPHAGIRLVDLAMSNWGRLDVVVNNASSFAYKPVETLSRGDWQDLFTLKLLGYWSLMVAALPELKKQGGSIVNVSGGAGIMASPNTPHVGAINAAVISMTESYALQVASSGVRVNVVTPGAVDTDRFATRVAQRVEETGVSPEQARSELGSRVPVGFPASPDELAKIIVILSSPLLQSTTGAHVVIDGAGHLQGRGREWG